MSDHYYKIGPDLIFEINTGTEALPVWVQVLHAENISADIGKGEISLTAAASTTKMMRGGKLEVPLSFDYSLINAADPIVDMIWDSFVKGAPVNFALTTEGAAGASTRGWSGWYEVFKFPLKKASEEEVLVPCEAKPTDYMEPVGSTLVPMTFYGQSA